MEAQVYEREAVEDAAANTEAARVAEAEADAIEAEHEESRLAALEAG